ncbi:translation factor SUA5 [Ignisphaera aggregans DSM 17230]|uniref:Threonylcarbamoyl-AMP synthase n=1 Tax=Ignisphaera aggregans (strain DSM 17230 / JCM 13409 / AQ1.S1) TaxID=583356 RepID=E0SQT8_IGNAA|nr:translation factor SUA5 [Ignisphaera aggregans DSM 17230]
MVLTKVHSVDPLNPDEDIIDRCCKAILNGAIIVFPTETVYGLGAYVYNVEAVRKIFIAKSRPMDNPLIVHISKIDQLYEIAIDVPEIVNIIAENFWPGPLTILLRKNRSVPKEVSGGLDTVAVRMPAHPVALKLIDCSGPIAAPSANISGRPSPTSPYHVLVDMFGRADIILDAGETFFGVESTIIDILSDPPKLLRPGAMPIEKIEEVLNKRIEIPVFALGYKESEKALAPGMKYKHYAPKTPLIIAKSRDYTDCRRYAEKVKKIAMDLIARGRNIAVVASTETADIYIDLNIKIFVLGSRKNLFEIAKNLFGVLRELDRSGVDMAIVEGYPEKGIGITIMNRLIKASGYRVVDVDTD